MEPAIVIQARMTSTRLPGKVLMDILGVPMLTWQIRRLKRCRMANDIVVATTTNALDDPVAELAHKEKVGCFRGDEHDVLARYVGAAKMAEADVIVRVTADCPLIDPAVIDRVVSELIDNYSECDYVSNVLPRTFPQGLDVEAFHFDVLLRLHRMAISSSAREHVTTFLYIERPDLFTRRSVVDNGNNSDLRWCVDVIEDLALVRAIYKALGDRAETAPFGEVLSYVRAHPEISNLNASISKCYPVLQDV